MVYFMQLYDITGKLNYANSMKWDLRLVPKKKANNDMLRE